jgi:hypothetical protein
MKWPGQRGLSLLVTAGVAVAGLYWLAVGVLAQWLRYRDYLAQGLGFDDRACPTPYCDFPLFWEAGRLARVGDPAAIYDKGQFLAATSRVIAPHVNPLPFLYPPFTLLAAAPMSLPGLVAGYYGFTAVALVLSVWLLRRAGIGWHFIMIGLAGLPAMWSLYLGQFGMLSGALLICGLARLDKSPVLAGALLGLLCLKPQYALLVPVVVCARRDVRAMAAGAGTLALLGALSVWCFGWQAWAAYFGPGEAATRAILQAPFQRSYEMWGVSVFWLARSLGAAVGTAYAVQCFVLLLAVAAAWRLWRRDGADPVHRLAMTVCLTLLASPYGFLDDLVAYSVMLPMLARRDTPLVNAALALLWLAPALSVAFTHRLGFLPMPFCVLAALAIAWRQPGDARIFSAFGRRPVALDVL